MAKRTERRSYPRPWRMGAVSQRWNDRRHTGQSATTRAADRHEKNLFGTGRTPPPLGLTPISSLVENEHFGTRFFLHPPPSHREDGHLTVSSELDFPTNFAVAPASRRRSSDHTLPSITSNDWRSLTRWFPLVTVRKLPSLWSAPDMFGNCLEFLPDVLNRFSDFLNSFAVTGGIPCMKSRPVSFIPLTCSEDFEESSLKAIA
jgi:hypothetical protein